jgi:paraquat-inducible protein B
MPKMKGETYNERIAKDALIKVQRAFEQINWQKIERQLKYNRRDIAKLKKEIALQIQNLDWQKINSDVQTRLSQQQLEKLQQVINQDQAIKQYQQHEAYSEALQKQLAEQERVMKESQQRMRESQQAAEQQQKKFQLEMKKRRIICI